MSLDRSAQPSSSRSFAAIGLGSLVNAATGVILTFALPRLTSLETFGYWRTFLLYAGYAGVVHLGLVDGALVRWSVQEKGVPRLAFREALGGLLLQHTIFALFGILLLTTSFKQRPYAGVLVTSLCIYAFISNLSALWQAHFQGKFRFSAVAFATTAPNLFFVLLLPILHHWHLSVAVLLRGYLVAVIITVAVLSVVGWQSATLPKGNPLETQWPKLTINGLRPVAVGWPIMLANFGYGVMQSADRITVNITRPIHDFAIYSLAQSMIFVPVTIIAAITRVAFSHFARVDVLERKNTYRRTTRIFSLLWLVLLPYFFVADWVVHTFLSKYIPGLPSGRVLLLSVLFLGLISVVQANSFTLVGRQKEFFLGSIAAVVLAFVTAWIGSHLLNSLTAVAWSQVLSAALWWLGNEWALRRHKLLPFECVVRVVVVFIFGVAGLYGSGAYTSSLLLRTVIYAAAEIGPILLLFRTEIRELLFLIERRNSQRTP